MKLRPMSEAPIDRPVLAYFAGRADMRGKYCVMYFDETTYCWYTTYGRRFVGPPTHFAELDFSPDLGV